MKVTVEQLPRRQALLNIEAEAPEVDHARDHAFHHLSQRIKIPGFRQGKAPRAMVTRYVGEAAIMEEAVNHLIPEVTQKAILEQALEAIGVPKVDVETINPVIKWKATVDLTPHVELGGYKAIRFPIEAVEVKEEQIQKVLEDIRFQQAPWEPQERPIQMGDLTTIDMKAESEGKTLGSDSGAQYQMVEGSGVPVPGFAEQLVGLKAGETKEFSIKVPEDDPRKSMAGKDISFSVTVKEVKGKLLPEINDDFAKGVGDGGYDSLQALRDYVTKQLTETMERDAKEKLREKVVDEIVSKATFEFSPNITDREAEEMFKEQTSRLEQNRVSLDDYLKGVGKTQEQMVEELKPTAEERIKRTLAIAELIKQENIEVTDEDVDTELNGLISSGGEKSIPQLQRIFDTENGRKSIHRTLQQRKVMDKLIEIVTQPAA